MTTNVGSTTTGLTRPALLVIDLQQKFKSCVSDRMLQEVNATINACRAKQIPIIYTKTGHRFNLMDSGGMGRMGKYLAIGSDGHHFMDGLAVNDDDIVVDEKRTYDAFHNTPLDALLRANKVETVIIVGVVTHICCETTARSAFIRDFDVVFASDGNGDFPGCEDMHAATLKAMARDFGRVITCEEIRREVESL